MYFGCAIYALVALTLMGDSEVEAIDCHNIRSNVNCNPAPVTLCEPGPLFGEVRVPGPGMEGSRQSRPVQFLQKLPTTAKNRRKVGHFRPDMPEIFCNFALITNYLMTLCFLTGSKNA